MTVTPKALNAVALPATAASLYTANNCRTTITKATITNQGTLNNTYSFYIVPSAGAAGSGNRIVFDEVLSGKEGVTVSKLIGQVLNPGDMLWGEAPVTTTMIFKLSFIEQT